MVRNIAVKNQIFVCFDFETTGLRSEFSEIIEIGACKFTIAGGLIEEYSELIKPVVPIPASITMINGINNEMVKDSPYLHEVFPSFIDFIEDHPLIAHNASFDASFLIAALNKLQISIPTTLIFDTLLLSKKGFPQSRRHSLAVISEYLGLHNELYHRGLVDSLAAMKIFKRCVEQWDETGKKRMNSFIKYARPFILQNFYQDRMKSKMAALANHHLIESSIREKFSLDITYESNVGEITKRKITPKNLIITSRGDMLRAFCHLRNEERTFRLDRIKKISSEHKEEH